MRADEQIFAAVAKVASRQASLLLVAFPVCLGSQSTCAQESSPSGLSTNAALVLYLQNPPWIKEMRFIKSTLNVAKSPAGKNMFQQWINETNRFAIQPSGMFYELLTPSPEKFAAPATETQRVVFGICEEYFWQGNVDAKIISFSSKRPELGKSAENHLQTLEKVFHEWDIDPVRYFGFPALVGDSFKLLGGKNFEAVTIKNEPLCGQILENSNGRLMRLEYSMMSHTNDYSTVSYDYGDASELPNYIERHNFHRDGTQYGLNLTNWIEAASYGTASEITNGYSYGMFFSNLNIFSLTMIESNGQRFSLTPLGQFEAVSEHFSAAPEKGHHTRIILLALITSFAGCAFLMWKFGLRRETSTKEIKQ